MEHNREQNKIRLLRADEIECRVGTVSEKGISLLLYKDARADMKILDEVFGPMNWQRKHEVIGGSLYCTVSVWDGEKGQWIPKMDVGSTESHMEKEKTQASDSFKRACVCIGIGRELYTAPFIWISAGKTRIERRPDGKLYTQEKFTVSDISYNEESRVITGLVIVNRDGNRVYELKTGKAAAPDLSEAQKTGKPANGTEEKAAAMDSELKRTGVLLEAVLKRYGVSSIQDMDDATY
ncbi:MAG: hypothetical protein NC121_20285, partial [Blautia sp.]|nr:hypothetical protein [Blautia sp.]